MVVIGDDTVNANTDVGKKLKEKVPNCKINGVAPIGSEISCTNGFNVGSEVEGIGNDFAPSVLDSKIVDFWVNFKFFKIFSF